MRLALLALALLLAGCAPKVAPIPATATAPQRVQWEVCHAYAQVTPKPAWPGQAPTWYNLTPDGLALGIAFAPIWYPIAKTRSDQRAYDAAFDRCIIHGVEAMK